MKLTIDDLKPAPYNPRDISDAALAGLKESVSMFGDISGVTWNKRTGHLVSGHQRLKALKELHGDAVRIDSGPGGHRITAPDGSTFSIRVVDWDEETEKAANIAANNPHIAGIWKEDELRALLDDINKWSPDAFSKLKLSGLGKSTPEGTAQEIQHKYLIVIECPDETEQLVLIDKLMSEGIECKAAMGKAISRSFKWRTISRGGGSNLGRISRHSGH